DGASAAATDGAHPGRGQGDGGEPASPNFADNGNAQSAHATGEDPSVPSTPADNGHHPIADPEINLASNAKDNSPQDDHAAHPTDPPVDPNPPDSFKFANGDSVHPGSSAAYEPAALAPAKPFDVSGMSAGPDQLIFAENAGHDPAADHKPDM